MSCLAACGTLGHVGVAHPEVWAFMRVTCSGVAKLEPSLFLAAITCALWAAEMVWRRPFLHGSVQPKPQKKGKHGRSVVSRLEAPMAASN